tara:strand:+ start:37 stop:486 length:450 start_codon:yes stop_codon:yes gene_type:complete
MAQLNLTFTNPINTSLTVGDDIYFFNPSTYNNVDVNSNSLINNLFGDTADNINFAGTITNIDTSSSTSTTITINTDESQDYWGVSYGANTYLEPNVTNITTDTFIFFKKNEVIEGSSVKGYYGLARFTNNTTDKAELYSTSADIEQSSE